jgi:hypothetical protein
MIWSKQWNQQTFRIKLGIGDEMEIREAVNEL